MFKPLKPAVKTQSIQVNHLSRWQADIHLAKAASLTATSVIYINDDCPHVEEITFSLLP